MNAKKMMIAAAVFAAAGSAYATTDITGNFEDFTNVPSTKTRAEVIAELKQAKAQGQVASTEWVEPSTLATKSTRTREEVRAEAIQYAKTHHKINPDYDFGG